MKNDEIIVFWELYNKHYNKGERCMMDKIIKKKLEKKFRKEREQALAERKYLDVKIVALDNIIEDLEKTDETEGE